MGACAYHTAQAGVRPSQQRALGLQLPGVLCGVGSGSGSVTALCPMPGTHESSVKFVLCLRAGEPHGFLVELGTASGLRH